MYLIADSGATKTEWSLFTAGEEITRLRGLGLNPNAISSLDILDELARIQQENFWDCPISHLWFYGSGLGGSVQEQFLERALQGTFPATQCRLATDLVAAIRCTGRQSGIVCILGTGSNACQFEGDQVVQQAGGDGYLFGDEGSGADLGKHLIQAFLRNALPPELREEMEDLQGQGLHAIKMKAYRASRPSAYLAQFARYAGRFQQHPAVRDLILARFRLFFQLTVQSFPQAAKLPVDLVGSIGYHFYPLLSEAAQSVGIQLGNRWQSPLDGLLKYHLSASPS